MAIVKIRALVTTSIPDPWGRDQRKRQGRRHWLGWPARAGAGERASTLPRGIPLGRDVDAMGPSTGESGHLWPED